MKRFAVFMFLFALCQTAVSASAQTLSHDEPFTAAGTGTVVQNGFTGTFTGSVVASFIGAGQFNGSSTLNNIPPACGSGNASGMIVLHMTATNGDRLDLAEQSETCQLTFPPATVSYFVHGPYTITGGTGRFAHATGRGVSSAVTVSSTNSLVFTDSGDP